MKTVPNISKQDENIKTELNYLHYIYIVKDEIEPKYHPDN